MDSSEMVIKTRAGRSTPTPVETGASMGTIIRIVNFKQVILFT
jgi:hypothetical protein